MDDVLPYDPALSAATCLRPDCDKKPRVSDPLCFDCRMLLGRLEKEFGRELSLSAFRVLSVDKVIYTLTEMGLVVNRKEAYLLDKCRLAKIPVRWRKDYLSEDKIGELNRQLIPMLFDRCTDLDEAAIPRPTPVEVKAKVGQKPQEPTPPPAVSTLKVQTPPPTVTEINELYCSTAAACSLTGMVASTLYRYGHDLGHYQTVLVGHQRYYLTSDLEKFVANCLNGTIETSTALMKSLKRRKART